MAIKPVEFKNFETLNTAYPTEIPDNHLSDTLNMVRNDDGLWENRKGIQQFGSTVVGSGASVHSLRFWKNSAGNRYLTIGSGTKLYSYSEGSAYNDGTFTEEKVLTSSNKWDSLVYRDTLVLGNGVDDLETTTDNNTFTTRAAGVNVVKARFFEVGRDFTIFSGITGSVDKDKVLFSTAATTSPWQYDNVGGIVNVDLGNSDTITGIKSLGQNIIVCKNRQSYSIALADFSRTELDWGGGCESNRAILQTQKNALFVAGRQGIFNLSKTQIGTNQIFGTPESEEIKSLYDLATTYSDINSVYTFDNNWALWNVNTSLGRLTFLRDLDYSKNVWTYLKGINSLDWTIYEDSSGNYHYLYGDAVTDKIWELFKGRDDNGAPILSRITGKRTDFGLPGRKKHIMYVDVFGYMSNNAEWNVELYKDDVETTPKVTYTIDSDNIQGDNALLGLGASSLGSSPLGGVIQSADGDIEVFPFYARIPVDDYYEKLQWSLWNNQKDARVILRSVVAYVEAEPLDAFDTDFIL